MQPDVFSNLARVSGAVDLHPPRRFTASQFSVSPPNVSMESGWELFESPLGLARGMVSGVASAQASFRRYVQQNGQIRDFFVGREFVRVSEAVQVQVSAVPLVRNRRVGESITDDGCASVKIGNNHVMHELSPGSHEEQGIGSWDIIALGLNDVADLLAQGS